MFSIFGGGKKKPSKAAPLALEWAKSDSGKYFNLLSLREDEAGLKGLSGIFAIWSVGLKVTYIYIGSSSDLALTIRQAKDNKEITAFHEKGSLGVTWVGVADKYRNRMACYLREVIKPAVPSVPELETSFASEEPLAVFPPFR